MEKEKVDILKEMLRRIENGTLGCSGFSIKETDTLRFVIKGFEDITIKKDKEVENG